MLISSTEFLAEMTWWNLQVQVTASLGSFSSGAMGVGSKLGFWVIPDQPCGDLATAAWSQVLYSQAETSQSWPPFSRIWLVQNHYLEICHPRGLLRSVMTLRKCSKSNIILLPVFRLLLDTDTFFILSRAIFLKMKCFPLTLHTIQVRVPHRFLYSGVRH